MDKENFYADSITIKGKEIPVRIGFLPVGDLKFYPDNPRIYSMMSVTGREPTQEEVYDKLINMEHVRTLISTIKSNKGLREPIIVKDYLVLEGNSRLAAYKYLANQDPITWGTIKCKILPANIGNDIAFAILSDHITGKKDWAPYEQAAFLYRRHKEHDESIKEISSSLGLSTKHVNSLIEVIEFMKRYKEEDINKWSYYYEYLKSSRIRKAREKYADLDRVVVKQIKKQEIPKAADLRDKLPVILRSKGNKVNKYLNGERTFEEAYDIACHDGTNDSCYKRLNKFRIWIVDGDTESNIVDAEDSVKDKCKFELAKIHKRVDKLIDKLDKTD